MLTMWQTSGTLYLCLAAATFVSVVSHDCAFIPGPVSESNDTSIVQVDCHGRQRADDRLADNTGDNAGVVVYLVNCTTVPVGLFVNVSTKVSTVAVLSNDSKVLLEGTFEGLANIMELRLEGFRNLHSLGSSVFRPLRSLERLVLVGFGADRLSYAELGAALKGLSGTPLSRIVMHEIHSSQNELMLDVATLFQMRNVSVRELSFSNNIVTGISGKLSRALPDLNYVCVGGNPRHYTAMNALLDVWLFSPNVVEVVFYAYPDADTHNPASTGSATVIHKLDIDILLALALHRMHSNCYLRLQFPLTPSLRRLTVRNFQLLEAEIEKPVCFGSNNVEYLDFAGSPLPRTSMRITGLDRLKHLDLQNTGITELPDDFLRHFPSLETINLVQLAIGDSIKQINSSFFGNCPTLTEIHLGDCRLTTIPPTTFLLVPSLRTLNLSSNSLRTFHVSLQNSSNLSHLNLSGNAISTLSEDVLAELDAIAQRRLQDGETLTLDLRENRRLGCLCNSTHLVRRLQGWVEKREVSVPGFDELACLYPNGSVLAMSEVDVHRLESQCRVLGQVKNGSDCPCDDDRRRRLEQIRLSLHGYFCRRSDGQLVSMTTQPLPSCHDFYRSATFIGPLVVGGVLATFLAVALVALYRHRR